MRVAVGLTNEGRIKARAFLLKYDKDVGDESYNMRRAIEDISDIVVESKDHSYELGMFNTNTRTPEKIGFAEADIDWVDLE